MADTKISKTKKNIIRIRKSKNARIKDLVDTSKYCGSVKFSEDALTIQKRLRNEWE